MANKRYCCLILLCCGFYLAAFAQITVAAKIGGGPSRPTYIYENRVYHDRYHGGNIIGLAVAFRSEIGQRFALGAETGYHTITNYIDVKTPASYRNIAGRHTLQQVYLAFVPQYSLTRKPGLLFVNAGLMFLLNTRSELEDYPDPVTLDVGPGTTGFFGGIGSNVHFRKIGLQLEIRPTFQDASGATLQESSRDPDQYKLHYVQVLWGLTFHF